MLYTDYIFLFQAAGLILLVAMIGAIVLTLRDRRTSRHQNIATQTRAHRRRDAGDDARSASASASGDAASTAADDRGRVEPEPSTCTTAHGGDARSMGGH